MARTEELEACSACHKTPQAFGQVSGVGSADFRNFIIQSRSRFKQTGNGGFGTHERKIHTRGRRVVLMWRRQRGILPTVAAEQCDRGNDPPTEDWVAVKSSYRAEGSRT